jgi:hypothetical protein
MLSEPIRFRTLAGEPIEAPREWQPALVELPIDSAAWPTATLRKNGEPLALFQQLLAGGPRVLARWPLLGTGNYRLELAAGSVQRSQIVTVRPGKIAEADYHKLLSDLQFRLPQAIAIGLQRCGGFAGVTLPPPGESLYAEELARLRDAVSGGQESPGLVSLLPRIASDPHRVLVTTDVWEPRERARRPHPARLTQALTRGGNLAGDRLPLHVLDSRGEHSLDVYENQLLRAYHHEVELRLRRLLATQRSGVEAEAQALLQQLTRARQGAPFLEEVSLPKHLMTRPTLVLLKRPEYRAALDGYLRLHRSRSIRLETELLDAPLENLPHLYQLWCTLEICCALLEVAHPHGFTVQSASLVQRDRSGFFIRVLPNGRAAVVLTDPHQKRTVYLTPEQRFTASGRLRSISFTQQPDVTLRLEEAQGRCLLYLFDPKYRLDSEEGGEGLSGQPKKQDIDKMHTYRDAIRDPEGNRVVQSAAILYPGKTMVFPGASDADSIAALCALPTQAESLQITLQQRLGEALDQEFSRITLPQLPVA